MPGHTSAAPVTQNHLSKPEDLMFQNATPLKKSPPGLPNSSDEDVSCTAPATENASLQILFKCPTPAIVFGNAAKPSHFAHFWEDAQSLAPATRKHIWTSKKWRENVVLWCALYILTSKCVSRHNSVHCFDISTPKSGPSMVFFVHVDFEMCFAPQRHALFRHRNFQKWSKPGVSCTFLTSKCASRHNGVQFLISHLASWLRARRFSEPTFRPSGATNHLKNTNVSRLSYLFARSWIFFLLILSLLWSSLFYSSLLSDSSRLCFSSLHIVGNWLLNFLR